MPTAVRLILAGALLTLIAIGLVQAVRLDRGKPVEFWFSMFAIGCAASAGLAMLVLGSIYR